MGMWILTILVCWIIFDGRRKLRKLRDFDRRLKDETSVQSSPGSDNELVTEEPEA